MQRRELLVAGAVAVIAGCSSDEPSDDPVANESETEPLGNESDDENETDLENETETEAPDPDDVEDPDGGDGSKSDDGPEDEDETDDPDPALEEARGHVDTAQTRLEEAVEIYVDAAGPNRDDPAEIGVTGGVPRGKVTGKTDSADSALDEAAAVIEENGIEDEDLQEDLGGTRATAALLRAAVRAHYQTNQHYDTIGDMVPWIRTEDEESVEWGFDSLEDQQQTLDDQLTTLDEAYDRAASDGDEYVSVASVRDLVTTAEATASKLVVALDELWLLVSVDLMFAHQAYEDGNYKPAEKDAEEIVSELEALAGDVDALTVPTGGEDVVAALLDEITARRDEAEELRQDAAEAADE